MSFKSLAQEILIVDPSSINFETDLKSEPLEVLDEVKPETFEEINVKEPVDVEIFVEELPGAPADSELPEPVIEVEEEEEKEEDENDAKNAKNKKWDWASKGPDGFVPWIKERLNDVPKHSGKDSAGIARAVAYMEKLDSEISKAMRLDLEGELDASLVEDVRAKIEDGISRLNERLDKINKNKKKKNKKANYSDEFVKEAQKITGVKGVVVTVPLLISRIARIIINGTISAGHATDVIYNDMVKKYSLDMREQAELMQLLSDSGFTLRQDRGYDPNEEFDPASSDNYDFSANYGS